ncbi:MAG: hypothetical protein WCO98_13025 [bacterium]
MTIDNGQLKVGDFWRNHPFCLKSEKLDYHIPDWYNIPATNAGVAEWQTQ